MTAIFPFRQKTPSNVARRRSDMDRLFDDIWSSWSGLGDALTEMNQSPGFSPRVAIKETEEAYRVTAEVPGLNEDDIELGFSDNTLTLKGERKVESKDEGETFKYNELSYGSFFRSIPLSEDIDDSKIEAEFRDGILNVHLPKKPERVTAQKKIKIKRS